MMPFRRALLSAFTLVGGHFLNRRLDRVVLVGTLLVAVVMAVVAVPMVLLSIGKGNYSSFLWALRLPVILVGALGLVSAWLTFSDAKQPPGPPLRASMRIVAGGLSLFGVLLVAAVSILSAARFTPAPGRETPSTASGPYHGRQPFFRSVYFGGDISAYDELPAPPRGPKQLRGRITLDGAGVEGVELDLFLNNQYRAQHLVTDSHGMFAVPLTPGSWHINHIEVTAWNGKSRDRDFVVFSGHESMKSTGQYTGGSYIEGGLDVSLPVATNMTAIELQLREVLSMTWPPRSDSSGSGSPRASEDANVSTDAIAWQPVKAASEYEVQISHVTREGTTTKYFPILMRRVPGTALPLASLPQRSDSSASADEYTVRVYAFDQTGALVTESSVDLDDRMFRLTGGIRLGKEQQSFGNSQPEVISAEYETNDLRLSLAAKLLDQKQFDEAGHVLDQVTKDAPLGRASLQRGRLAALKGDCVTANKLFDKADVEGGAGCAPIEDRKLCSALPK